MGAREMFNGTCRSLDRKIKIEADGKTIPLPRLQGVVILNIASYMGGVNFWGNPGEGRGFRLQSISDGYLEVSLSENRPCREEGDVIQDASGLGSSS